MTNRIATVLYLLLLQAVSTHAQAGSVLKVSKKKGLVQFDTDGDKQFRKGTKVCIWGENEKKIACGKVRSVKGEKAVVRIKRKAARKIKKGFSVNILAKSMQPEAPGHSIIVRGFWVGGITPQVTYNKLAYLPPEDGTTPASLWESSGAASGLVAAFGLELELPSFSAAAGFRFRSYQPVEFTTDYVKPADNFAVTGTQTGSSIGLYLDYYYLALGGLAFGVGLDIDMNTVTLTATKKDDSGEVADAEIASVSSSLTAISLRAPVRYDLEFGGLGLSAGLNLILPLSGSATTTATVTDSDNGDKLSGDPSTDLATQLGHETNSLAIEIVFGAYLGF